jgi:hypothetical protein
MQRSRLRRPWLAEEDTALLRYADQGLPPRTIAIKFRRTARAVQHRIAALRRKERSEGDSAAHSQPAEADGVLFHIAAES